MYTYNTLPDQFENRSELLKFGCISGLTRGSFHLNGTSVRRREIEGSTMHFGFQLHNQFEVLTIGPIPEAFAETGDSGALVLIPHRGNCSDLRAVGILVGNTFNNTYLVTPIWDVLEALNVPHRLKTFPSLSEDRLRTLSDSFACMSLQSSPDRSVFEESMNSLTTLVSSAQISETNDHFNAQLKALKEDVYQQIKQAEERIEESNERRHRELMSMLSKGNQ